MCEEKPCEAFQYLKDEEKCKLISILEGTVEIHGRGNFPTLEVSPKEMIKTVRTRLRAAGIAVSQVRLNGSRASYVLSSGKGDDVVCNDLDVIFNVALDDSSELQSIKSVLMECILHFFPPNTTKERISESLLQTYYVQKLVKVDSGNDLWSLISFNNNHGKNIDFKFVHAMKRQFEFSVDSFQIILDPLLDLEAEHTPLCIDSIAVRVMSMYGDLPLARSHLENRLIATTNPEEIYGGGLLKYCRLLVQRYTPATEDVVLMQRYMCSRFFIDFKDLNHQQMKLESYLTSHFRENPALQCEYLQRLHDVVAQSTVCLMSHDRQQTLSLIRSMAAKCSSSLYSSITVFYAWPRFAPYTLSLPRMPPPGAESALRPDICYCKPVCPTVPCY